MQRLWTVEGKPEVCKFEMIIYLFLVFHQNLFKILELDTISDDEYNIVKPFVNFIIESETFNIGQKKRINLLEQQ